MTLSKDEAIKLLAEVKWAANDLGISSVAYIAEQWEMWLVVTKKSIFTEALCKQAAELIIKPGRAGRVTLVLYDKASARVLMTIVAILMSIKVD